MAADDGGAPATPAAGGDGGKLRADLAGRAQVDTAARFLLGAQVRSTAPSEQDAFLRRKGLSDGEIAKARRRALAQGGGELALVPPVPVDRSGHGVGLGAQLRGGATALALVAGFSYVAYRFCREYVLPKFFDVPSPRQERERLARERADEMGDTLRFVVDSLNRLVEDRARLEHTVTRLTEAVEKNGVSGSGDTQRQVNDMKNDITVIKGLLLSRSQFAAAPILPPAATTADNGTAGTATPPAPPAVVKFDFGPSESASTADGCGEPPVLRPPAWQMARCGGAAAANGDGGENGNGNENDEVFE